MSLPIWTRDALLSEAKPYKGNCWRLVEAQHRVSSLRLVDTLDEQQILEDMLEESKPGIPAECRHLDYLIATPFRYGAPYPKGSRFRRAGLTEGVYYSSETPRTAVAEMAFYRIIFYADSPATSPPDNAAEYTAFSVHIETPLAIDLTAAPLSKDHLHWTDPTDYAACQQPAYEARDTEIAVIRYQSVRDPEDGANVAVLKCKAFARPEPVDRQSWHLRISHRGVQAICEHPREQFEFPCNIFANDPRIADFVEDK